MYQSGKRGTNIPGKSGHTSIKVNGIKQLSRKKDFKADTKGKGTKHQSGKRDQTSIREKETKHQSGKKEPNTNQGKGTKYQSGKKEQNIYQGKQDKKISIKDQVAAMVKKIKRLSDKWIYMSIRLKESMLL